MIIKNLSTKRFIVILTIILLILITAWRIYNGQQVAAITIQPLAVNTVKVTKTLKPNNIKLTGTIEGLESAIISSRFSGKINNILVEDGQAVNKGDVLLQLDTVELVNSERIAQNNVQQTEANYNTAKLDYQRYCNLYAKNAVTKQQLESAYARMITSQTEVNNAYANLNSAQKQIADGSVQSPITGLIANKLATNGQVVSAGAPLLTVEQIDQVYVIVNIEQKDIAAAKIGSTATITVDAYPNQKFVGTVTIVNPVANDENRMFKVKLKIDNFSQQLKPGMFAKVTLLAGEAQAVLAIPRSSVISYKGLHYVYIDENNKAKKALVEIGDFIGDLIEVKTGLKSGMSVITNNLDKIKGGDSILAKEVF